MLTVPLSVRLRTSRADTHITAQLRSLRFRTVAVGGYASATMALDRPLTLQPDEITYYGQVYVYNTRTGRVVWEGRLEDPGRGAGMDGQIWQLTAIGPSGHARDRRIALTYVDTRLEPLVRVDNVTPGADDSISTDPGAAATIANTTQSLVLRFPDGLVVGAGGARVVRRYDLLRQQGQKLARYDYTWDAGITSGSLAVQGHTRVDGGATGETSRNQNANTAGGGSLPRLITTDWASGRNTLDLRWVYGGGAGTFANDTNWVSISNLVIQATRFNKSGTELTAAASYPSNTVLASDIVADLLGRLLPQYDGANASIATTSFGIEQLSYPDGVDAAGVFDDLMRFEPAYRWGAYESNSAGKYRFEWASWPTTVRYEATADDGFDSPGSAEGLYNAVTVRWRSNSGQTLTTRRTATVSELTAAGLTREALLDLGDEVGTLANANQAGDQFLADHAKAPNQGRLKVARKVMDLARGTYVDPWEIEAAELIRVRGVRPRVDALNATARDGVTVFKIASMEYDSAQAAATLELDSYARSTARALAKLATADQRRR